MGWSCDEHSFAGDCPWHVNVLVPGAAVVIKCVEQILKLSGTDAPGSAALLGIASLAEWRNLPELQER